jgi:hypothetical protein
MTWSHGGEKWSSQEKRNVLVHDIKDHLRNNVKTSNLNTDPMTITGTTASQLQVSRQTKMPVWRMVAIWELSTITTRQHKKTS